MLVERQFQSRVSGKVFIFICAVIIVLTSTYLFAAEQTGASEPARYRVYSLKHISAEQGKQYLVEAGIGTVSQLANTNALLVTALPRELMKTTAILALVDSKEQFVIKAILPASEANSVPPKGRIEAEVGDVSIGTFSNPPSGDGKAKAIIDIHNDAVIAIASAEKLEKIISAIERLRTSEPQAPEPVEPSKTVEPNQAGQAKTEEVSALRPKSEAELYKAAGPSEPTSPAGAENREPDELFGLLAKGEEMAARSRQVKTRPNEPNAVVIAPGREAPAKPSAAAGEPKIKPESKPAVGEEMVMAGKSKEVAEPCAAVRSYQPGPISGGEEMLELSLPEKLNIVDLLDLVGKYLHLDYLYDEAEIKGEVALKVQGPIKIKDLYPLLESVLKFKDFVMTRKGNLVTIVPVAKVLEVDPALLHDEMDKVRLGDVIVTRVFNLRYIDTTSAKNLLDGMKLSVSVTPIPETATIIVTGYAYRMARLEEILSIVDRPGEPKQFRFRQLKYTMANTLAPKIKTLIEQLEDMSITIAKSAQEEPATRRGRAQPRKPAGQPGQPAAPGGPTVYLDADERTNRILMIGVEGELAIVEQLVDTLDVAQQDLRTLRLYELQHIGADEVKAKLAELGIIGEAVTTTRSTGRSRISTQPGAAQPGATPPSTAVATAEGPVEQPQVIIIEATNSLLVNATAEQHAQIALILSYVDSKTLEEAIPYVIYSLENQDPEKLAEVLQKFIQETIKDKEGKIEKTVKKTEEDIIVVPDKNTFSIIVYANKKNQEWIGNLIRQLDKRRPQVLIDVMLVGITEVDAFTYDLQLVSKFPQMAPGGTMQKLTGGTTILSPFPSNTVKEATSIQSDTTGGQGFYADNHIQALLSLMQKKNYGRVLARPKILVNDNEKGHIDTTKTIYIARSASTVQTAVSGTATNVPISTSYTFDQFPSGIKLDITPHISEGSLLRLELQLSRSNQTAPAGTTADLPPGNKTEDNVNTVVTVPDNSTIILGGIITMDQGKTNWKVPLLGDIPLAGGLFRKINDSSNQTRLYVFVKANILRPDETVAGLADLQKMSDRNREAVESFEERFQKHQDWPGIKSEPMDPLRVLDAK